VTRRRAYEAHRRWRTRVNLRTGEDQAYYHQLSEAIHHAIDQLPPRRRMVFLLHRQHDLTYAEVAQTMGITRKTVENQMGRALKFLRNQLHEDLQPEW
jgi:RNA polymerase sigma-70 factor (ECF subfamily)